MVPWRFVSRLGHNEATQRCSTNKESCERHALVEVQGCASAMSILLVNGLLGILPRENVTETVLKAKAGLLSAGYLLVYPLPCRVPGYRAGLQACCRPQFTAWGDNPMHILGRRASV